MRSVLALIVWMLLANVAAAAGLDPAVAAAYAEFDVSTPSAQSVVICHGFGCKFRTPIAFKPADRGKLTQLLAPGRGSAEAERRAVATAIAWFGRRVAPQAGTATAVARAGLNHAGDPSQFDCIDASRNTTSLLVVLAGLNLLRHHQVEPPQARGYMLDGRWPHATAVLRERHGGRDWAVDSWTHRTGEKPDILPLEQWLAGE